MGRKLHCTVQTMLARVFPLSVVHKRLGANYMEIWKSTVFRFFPERVGQELDFRNMRRAINYEQRSSVNLDISIVLKELKKRFGKRREGRSVVTLQKQNFLILAVPTSRPVFVRPT